MRRCQLIGFAAASFALATYGYGLFAVAQSGGGSGAKPFLGTFIIEDRHSSKAEYTGTITITQQPKGYEVTGTLTQHATDGETENYRISGSYSTSKSRLAARYRDSSGQNVALDGDFSAAQHEFVLRIGKYSLYATPKKTSIESTTNNLPRGVVPCTAGEKAAFAKLTGAWKSSVKKVTIIGSCEHATGTMEWHEYCPSYDDPNNKDYKYSGSFKGRMAGAYLDVDWDMPAQGIHQEQKGSSTCSLASNALTCNFGCGGALKK